MIEADQPLGIAQAISRYIFLGYLLINGNELKALDFESASVAYQSKNYIEAFNAFSKLANAGDPRAQTIIGIMYIYGEGVQANDQRAFYWYQKAANQRYPPAQFNLSVMLLEGSGTPEDRKQAKYWLEQASSSGFERATVALEKLNKNPTISPSDHSQPWSQRWNLRLPNQIRENSVMSHDYRYKVYRVQLGAMRTIEGAQRLWSQIRRKDENFFTDKQPIFREGSSSGRRFVRLQVGPFETRNSANEFCTEVLAYRLSDGCIVRFTD